MSFGSPRGIPARCSLAGEARKALGGSAVKLLQAAQLESPMRSRHATPGPKRSSHGRLGASGTIHGLIGRVNGSGKSARGLGCRWGPLAPGPGRWIDSIPIRSTRRHSEGVGALERAPTHAIERLGPPGRLPSRKGGACYGAPPGIEVSRVIAGLAQPSAADQAASG